MFFIFSLGKSEDPTTTKGPAPLDYSSQTNKGVALLISFLQQAMSLGFLQHKDSVVDLASLLEAHHKDCPIDFADPKYSVGLEKVGDCAEVIFDSHTIADDAAAAFKADRLAEAGAEEENEFLEQDAHTDVLATAKVTSSVLNANRSTRTANVPASTTDDHFDWTTGQNYGYDADKNDVSLEVCLK